MQDLPVSRNIVRRVYDIYRGNDPQTNSGGL